MHFYLFLYGNLSVYRDIMISKFGGIGLIQGSADGMQLFFKGHFSKSDMFARTGLKCHLLLTLGRFPEFLFYHIDELFGFPGMLLQVVLGWVILKGLAKYEC